MIALFPLRKLLRAKVNTTAQAHLHVAIQALHAPHATRDPWGGVQYNVDALPTFEIATLQDARRDMRRVRGYAGMPKREAKA